MQHIITIITYQYSRTTKTISKARVTVVLLISIEANARRSTASIFLHYSSRLEWCVHGKVSARADKAFHSYTNDICNKTGTKRAKTHQVKYKLQTFPVLINCTL